jgi:hypothetical protein
LIRLIFYFVFSIQAAYGIYYETLPRGVRVLGVRMTKSSGVDSTFDSSAKEVAIGMRQSLGAQELQAIPEISSYLAQIAAVNPEAFRDLTLGEFSLNAEADVNVVSTGLGWGITDKLSLYGQLSFYRAEVAMSYNQIRNGNLVQVGQELKKSDSDLAQTVGGIAGNISGINGSNLQYLFTQTLGYKPLGKWYGSGYGDLEAGAIYNFYNETNWGLAGIAGIVAPTGVADDPDIVQDISFGDGQWDVFAELGGGIFLTPEYQLDGWVRYTVQLPASDTLRVPLDESFAYGKDSANFRYDLGDMIDIVTTAHWTYNNWLSFYGGQEFRYQFESDFDSPIEYANQIYESNSDRWLEKIRIGAVLSSVKLFQSKQFVLPGSIEFRLSQVIAGKNTVKEGRAEMEFRLYF